MESYFPSQQTTLLILLGASEWPLYPEFHSSKAFANASREFKAYFLDPKRFGLSHENFLDMFNSTTSSDQQDAQIGRFIERRLAALKEAGHTARDIVVFFVGHGGFVGRDSDFYLAIRRTRVENPRTSGIPMLSLADTITEKARHLRRIIILDCCFAAAAFSAFQAGPAQVAIEKVVDAFEVGQKRGGFPAKGTALLCSSNHKSPSLLLPDETSTMFTKALLDALTEGLPPHRESLSLREVKDIAASFLTENRNAPRPVVLSPDQSEGDIADIPFFPNPRTEQERARLAEEAALIRRMEEERSRRVAEEQARKSREAEQARLAEEERRRHAEQEHVSNIEEQTAPMQNQTAPLTTSPHEDLTKLNPVILSSDRLPQETSPSQAKSSSFSQIQHSNEKQLYEAINLLENGLYDEALTTLNYILASDSNFAYAQNARGLTLYYLKRYSEALTSLDRAVTLNAKDITAHYGRGLVLERLQRHHDAFLAYKQVTILDATYVIAWRRMGNVLSALKRYEEALTAYDRALQLDRNDSDATTGKKNVIQHLERLK
jgi:tetratricopeptide (TPR) repeat protein